MAGNKEAKEEAGRSCRFLKAPERYVRLGAQIPKSVLLGTRNWSKTL